MCAINPKRQQHFTLSVYTSLSLTAEQWDQLVMEKLLETEELLNTDARLRWHVAAASAGPEGTVSKGPRT